MENKFSDMDAYIQSFPGPTRDILSKIRTTIRLSAPDAEEAISYQMPTFKLAGNLVHFAAFKSHIGFYPAPTGIDKFKEELAVYKQGKGSIQFPLDQPMPYELIDKIVRYRVNQNLSKAALKKTQPPAKTRLQQ
jgi:uncharacterized protein YdhG (YjbR/CyaY superfamily)